MMTGRVEHQQAFLPVTFRLPGRPDLTIEFVVDTGFIGFLTLPPDAVRALALPFSYRTQINLANDSGVEVPVHTTTILWNDQEREVLVLATGRRPLLGTSLLFEQELVAQFVEGGLVTVDTV